MCYHSSQTKTIFKQFSQIEPNLDIYNNDIYNELKSNSNKATEMQ